MTMNITNINNNNIILISSNHINTILYKLDKIKNSSVWSYDHNKINPIFKNSNLNYNNYITFGDIFVSDYFIPSTLLFGLIDNINIAVTNNYEFIASCGKGSLWKPVYNKNYYHIGLIYSIEKPKQYIGIINKKCLDYKLYIKQFDILNSDNFLNSNNFGLITHSSIGLYDVIIKNYDTDDNYLNNGNNKYIDGDKVVLTISDKPWYVSLNADTNGLNGLNIINNNNDTICSIMPLINNNNNSNSNKYFILVIITLLIIFIILFIK